MPYSKNMADYRRNKAKMMQSKKNVTISRRYPAGIYKGTRAAGQAAG